MRERGGAGCLSALAVLAPAVLALAEPAAAQGLPAGMGQTPLILIGVAIIVLLLANLLFFATRGKSGQSDTRRSQTPPRTGEVRWPTEPRPPLPAESGPVGLRGLVLHGFDSNGQRVHFEFNSDELKDGVLVGRGADARARLDDDRVSKRHAQLRMIGERIEVKDLESVNHTYVNDNLVPKNGVITADFGDHVRFGPIRLVLSRL
jgi:hypothetical protein